nr:reverse transcriptase domain-containing protein [Tanacetum cinerariifolium]
MADRTMEELLQAPSKGYGEAIVIPEILAENFEIKTNLLQLVQANKFHGRENDNPHTHISNFKRMTATLKYRDVLNDAIKLMLFTYSLEYRARIWESSSAFLQLRSLKLAGTILVSPYFLVTFLVIQEWPLTSYLLIASVVLGWYKFGTLAVMVLLLNLS